jgi:hypothetical protein
MALVILFDHILLQYAIYMYYGEIELISLILAWYIDLHPSTIAPFTPISSNFPNSVVIGLLHGLGFTFCTLTVSIRYLYVLWRD